MAYSSSRPTSAVLASTSTSSSIRQQSNHNAISHQQSLALSSRIVSKKAELENLMRLRDSSGVMAMQMQVLETKIGTLKHGTEGSLPRCSSFCILPRFLQNVEPNEKRKVG
jgi:DASH complex subunit DAD2